MAARCCDMYTSGCADTHGFLPLGLTGGDTGGWRGGQRETAGGAGTAGPRVLFMPARLRSPPRTRTSVLQRGVQPTTQGTHSKAGQGLGLSNQKSVGSKFPSDSVTRRACENRPLVASGPVAPGLPG